MFRLVDQPLSYRQRATEWIYKMLFLWSRDPVPGPRTGPWLAWFATALVLWRCRRRIAKSILAVSPLRIFKRRATVAPLNLRMRSMKSSRHQISKLTTNGKTTSTGIKTKVKRLCTGDGPHVSNNNSSFNGNPPPMNYRVTRSGKIYGKYHHHKVTLPKKLQY
ncbi:uncharacterized protein LOC125499992 [Athalia rosae]|uniref:uncharacterized protein LOC125499992 n=1 Tax=Athalia rosae TaxID=37344 RepID=UPI0020334413|nr:uncharacterized protein LOC125499992 [Athalia rosae]